MSRYPDGMPSGRKYTTDVDCENCGSAYESRVQDDLGMRDILDACPICDGDPWCKECDLPVKECVCEEDL